MVAMQKIDIQEQYEGLPIDTVIHGDCLEILKTFPSNSVSAIVTDPPSSIHFMGEEWDSDKGGRTQWVAWLSEVMQEALRCCRPGGHALIWALPRTSHWTGMALEDAGWEVRDVITHLFGSGFPKNHNISASIDKELGAEREVQGMTSGHRNRPQTEKWVKSAQEKCHVGIPLQENGGQLLAVTFPATPEAAQWQGFGSALKPAVECWWLCRKPLSEKNIAQNVLRWNGCGALNIDQCRVNPGTEVPGGGGSWGRSSGAHEGWKRPAHEQYENSQPHQLGRFPSNLLMSHDARCIARGTKRVKGSHDSGKSIPFSDSTFTQKNGASGIGYADEHGLEEVPAFECVEGCPVRILGEQAGESKSNARTNKKPTGYTSAYFGIKANNEGWTGGEDDAGSKARYFTQFHDPLETLESPFHYFSKASKRDRSSNGAVQNTHPTTKNTELMRWLVRLVGVPGGVVLDPFAGSGSTLVACIRENMSFIGIEQEQEYVNIARARIAHAQQEAKRAESEGQEYQCVDSCPIKQLDAQSGIRKSGGGVKNKAGQSIGFLRGEENWHFDHDGKPYEASEGGASRYFQQFPPEPVSLWDEEVAE